MNRWKRSSWVLAVVVLAFTYQPVKADGCCINWSCSWSCSWSCCWPCCDFGCYSCYPCYPANCYYPCYAYYPVEGLVQPSTPAAPEQPRTMPKATPPTQDKNTSAQLQPVSFRAPAVLSMPDAAQRGLSLVRRKLLLKNRGPQSAMALYQRSLKAYGYGDYRESLDLAWAAVQCNDQNARFWYVKALCELALGDMPAARTSARRAAAQDLLAGVGSFASLDWTGAAENAFLRQAWTGLTTENARRIEAGLAAIDPATLGATSVARKTP
jgi:hypothetical protein